MSVGNENASVSPRDRNIVCSSLDGISDKVLMKSFAKRSFFENEVNFLKKFTSTGVVVELIDFSPETLTVRLLRYHCDLAAKLVRESALEAPATCNRIAQLVRAVQIIPAHGIIHNDIKPENCLLDVSFRVLKICDFEYACTHDSESPSRFVGTNVYAAPERLAHFQVTFATDVFSCGCTIFAMAQRMHPYAVEYDPVYAADMLVYEEGIEWETSSWIPYGQSLRTTTEAMLAVDAAKRPSMGEVVVSLVESCALWRRQH